LTVDAIIIIIIIIDVLVDMRSRAGSFLRVLGRGQQHGAMASSEGGLSVGRTARRKRRMDPAADSVAKAARPAPAGGTEPRFGPKGNVEATAAIRYILTQGASDECMLQLRQASFFSCCVFGSSFLSFWNTSLGRGRSMVVEEE